MQMLNMGMGLIIRSGAGKLREEADSIATVDEIDRLRMDEKEESITVS
jgi:hypothetical protein